jgi:hypothetical protein
LVNQKYIERVGKSIGDGVAVGLSSRTRAKKESIACWFGKSARLLGCPLRIIGKEIKIT